jgi:hypothetical protein
MTVKSGAPAIVHAIFPLPSLMDNGAAAATCLQQKRTKSANNNIIRKLHTHFAL